jgi:uncharacterized membrane protein
MNKLHLFSKKVWDEALSSHLRQKLFLIALLVILSFVYVMVFAPPQTEVLPAYDQASQRTVQKISSEAPINLAFHINDGQPIGLTLYFEAPEYQSADPYTIQVIDSAGTVVFENTFSSASLADGSLLTFGLANMPETGGDYTLSITADNIPEETALSLYLRQGTGGQTVPELDVTYSLGISPYILSLSFWGVLAGCILILFYSKKIHVNVLLAALVFGTFFALLTPILDVPDESTHLGKAFMVANGYLFDAPGGAVVSNGLGQITDLHLAKQTIVNTTLHGQTIADGFGNSTLGNGQFFLAYIPSAIVIFFFRIFHAGILPLFYAGRIINLVIYAIFAYFAVKTAPRFKIFFAVVALMPMSLYIAASYNRDFLTYALALLLAAYFTKMLFEKDLVVGKKQTIVFIILCSLTAMLKYNLLPLCLLMLFIPASRFTSKKSKAINAILAVVIPVAAAAGLYAINTYLISATGSADSSALTAGGVNLMGANVGAQLQFMLSSLTTSVSIFIRSFVNNTYYITQLFSFGWLTYSPPEVFIYLYIGFFALVAFVYSKYENGAINIEDTKMSFISRFGIFIVIALSYVLVNLLLYLTWTPVGAGTIQGVQGRYFIPLLLFLPFLSRNVHPVQSEEEVVKTHNNIQFVALCFIILVLMHTLFEYY